MDKSALDKSLRRKIYYSMVALFLLVAPAIILYSRGYLFDWSSGSLVSTGGIFIKTLQPGAQVFLDRQFLRETSFISRGALLTNILPGRYTLRVERDGNQFWSKVVRVRSGEVIEFRNIFLPPATITPQTLYTLAGSAAVRIMPLEGRQEVILEVGQLPKLNLTVINSVSGKTGTRISGVYDWQWDENGGQIYFSRRINDRMVWYRRPLAVERPGEERLVFQGLPKGFSPQDLTPHPTNPGYFYFLAGGGLFLQTRASVPAPIAEQVYSYTVTNDKIYFISRSGFFVQSDLEGRSSAVLGRKGLFLDETRPIKFFQSPGAAVALLDSANGLFLYRPSADQELQFIDGNVHGVDFNQDSSRMIYWNEHEISLYWLVDNRRQPFQLAGTREEILRSPGVIQQAFLDEEGFNLFYATSDGIFMSEVDSRTAANTYDLVEAKTNDFVLNKNSLALIWASGNKVFRASLK